MKKSEIAEQDRYLLLRQHQFRMAADILAATWPDFAEVQAIALTGSVARPLWKEVPRSSAFRRRGIEVWHECGDVDLVLWLDSQARLGQLRLAAAQALTAGFAAGLTSVALIQVDTFLYEPGTDRFLGRLCKFSTCPKDKPVCRVPGCGAVPFNRVFDGFEPDGDLLATARATMLYRRGEGRLRSAVGLPATIETVS